MFLLTCDRPVHECGLVVVASYILVEFISARAILYILG